MRILFTLSILLISVFSLNQTCQAEDIKGHTYTVKGVIKKLPEGQAARKSPMLIKHEQIPDYVGEDGTVVGMHAMTMPFEVSDSVDLKQFSVGDCISFTFDSWWKPKPSDLITKIEKIDCN